MMPALQRMASSLVPAALIAATQAFTEAGSDSSHAYGVALPGSLAQASVAFASVRAQPSTWAPRRAKTRAASSPIPELQPVTRMVLPASESPSVTCSAEVP